MNDLFSKVGVSRFLSVMFTKKNSKFAVMSLLGGVLTYLSSLSLYLVSLRDRELTGPSTAR